jgi:hypothetical protein
MEANMSDNFPIPPGEQPVSVPALEFAALFEKDREQSRREDELLPTNKAVLFGVLAAAGITTIIVHFDGYGDSGQIEDIQARIGEEPVELPAERIEFLNPIWGSSEINRQTHTIREVIETMAYDLLAQTHDGWENNDGAYGDFIFDVAPQVITLDYNERYASSENYSHEF